MVSCASGVCREVRWSRCCLRQQQTNLKRRCNAAPHPRTSIGDFGNPHEIASRVFRFLTSPSLIVTGGTDNMLRVWSPNLDCLAELPGHNDWINSCSMSYDQSVALSASRDSSLGVWDLVKKRNVQLISGAHGSSEFVNCCAFEPSPVCEWAVSGGTDWDVRLWDTHTWNNTQRLSGHSYAVRCLAVSPTRSFILSGSEDKSLIIYGATSGSKGFEKVATLEGHEASVRTCLIGPDGTWCVSGGEDGIIRIWDIRMMRCISALSHNIARQAMAQSDITADSAPRRWEGERLGSTMLHEVTACDVTSDGQTLVTVGQGVFVWDTRTWACIGYKCDDLLTFTCCALLNQSFLL
eukprot:c11862_g1_i1.p1 GENE.c11862_g1_i1~~c11862_g1_i1.p1  ORF type:complete len:351 (-),score=34.83 c11862_g1_i1:38-1090(-)